MKKTSLILNLLFGILICSCSDTKLPDTIDNEDIVVTEEIINGNAVVLGNLPDNFLSAILHRLPGGFSASIEDHKNVDVVFTSTEGLFSHKEQLAKIYENDGIIIIIKPDHRQGVVWGKDNGIFYAGDENDEKQDWIYAFDGSNSYYMIDYMPEGLNEIYYKRYFNNLTSWINDNINEKRVMVMADETAGKIQEMATRYNITTEVPIGLDKTIHQVASSKPDRIVKNSSIIINYAVYPMHVFDDGKSNSPGDYYLIDGSFTVQNGGMFQEEKEVLHGGVHDWYCGYWLKKYIHTMKLNANINNVKMTPSFAPAAEPTPATTQGSTNYTNGFSWSIGGSISGGVEGKKGTKATGSGLLTLDWNLEWSNTQSRDIQDVDILNYHNSSDASWTFNINNTPETGNLASHKNIPPVSKSNFSVNSTWVWYIPNVPTSSTGDISVEVSVEPTYNAYWFVVATNPGFVVDSYPIDKQTQTIKIPSPDRKPSGMLHLKNDREDGEYIHTVKIFESDGSTPGVEDLLKKETVYSNVDNTLGKDAVEDIPLHSKTYHLYYTIDGPDYTTREFIAYNVVIGEFLNVNLYANDKGKFKEVTR